MKVTRMTRMARMRWLSADTLPLHAQQYHHLQVPVNMTDFMEQTEATQKSGAREQRWRSKKKMTKLVRAHFVAGEVNVQDWYSRWCIRIIPEVGIQLSYRWQCEQFICAYTAFVGARNGINRSMTVTKVRIECKTGDCKLRIVFDWQQRAGAWKLNTFIQDNKECISYTKRVGKSAAKLCASAYTPGQIACDVMSDIVEDPSVTATK